MSYCPKCGQQIEPNMKYCASCGQKLINDNPDADIFNQSNKTTMTRINSITNDNTDPTFYVDSKGIRVTATRLIVPAQTRKEGPSIYSMANITSVKSEKDFSSRILGTLLAVLGIAIIIAHNYISFSYALNIGVVLLVLGLLVALIMRPTYHLKISSASGEIEPLKKTNKQEFDRIMTAINEALIKRG